MQGYASPSELLFAAALGVGRCSLGLPEIDRDVQLCAFNNECLRLRMLHVPVVERWLCTVFSEVAGRLLHHHPERNKAVNWYQDKC